MPQQPTKESHIKRMADLLCQGSTLTDLACPACASPLFKLKNGDLWCANCEKKVVVVKNEEEPAKLAKSRALDTLEATLMAKIQEIQDKMQNEQDAEQLQRLASVLTGLLENLEKTRKIKS